MEVSRHSSHFFQGGEPATQASAYFSRLDSYLTLMQLRSSRSLLVPPIALERQKSKVFSGGKSSSLLQQYFDSTVGGAVPWQAVLLTYLESLSALVIILLLVIFISILTSLKIFYDWNFGGAYAELDLTISIIFATELATRIYCYISTQRFNVFINSFLNILDVVVVLLDIALFSLDSQIGQEASFTKSLK
jgi:hypothetical protein